MTETTRTNESHARLAALTVLVLGAAAWRVMTRYLLSPDTAGNPLWNFSPVAAIALFGGMRFNSKWAALLIPLGAMALSDLVLHWTGKAPLQTPEEWMQQGITYLIFVGVVLLGMSLHDNKDKLVIANSTLLVSLVFFLVSNFVFWLLVSDSLPDQYRYPPTWTGLLECYSMALPFFQGTLMGDLFFAVVLFGGWALIEEEVPALRSGHAIAA